MEAKRYFISFLDEEQELGQGADTPLPVKMEIG